MMKIVWDGMSSTILKLLLLLYALALLYLGRIRHNQNNLRRNNKDSRKKTGMGNQCMGSTFLREKKWRWLRKGDVKGCTESLISSVQGQTLWTSYINFWTDNSVESTFFRMRVKNNEIVSDIVRKCSKLTQKRI